jgi:outer membrane immunogenic protein
MGNLSIALITAASTVAFTQIASAADLPIKAPIYKAPVKTHNWTGFYISGSAGYGWGAEDNVLLFTNPKVTVPGAVPSNHSYDLDGFIGGGGAGYNYQFDNIVFGLEVDFSYAHFSGTGSSSGAFAPIVPIFLTSPFRYTQTAKLNWLGTVRGRIGFTPLNNLLVYGTGGFAFGHAKATTLLTFPLVSFVGAASGTKSGWTAGGGVEYALGERWSAKIEYLYYDLGSLLVDDAPVSVVFKPTFETWVDFPLHGSIVRIGLNYQLF